MSFTQAMIQTDSRPAVDSGTLAACIRACFGCAQACDALLEQLAA